MFVFLSGTIENYWNVWRVAGKTALGLTFARRFIRSSIEYWSRSATNSMVATSRKDHRLQTIDRAAPNSRKSETIAARRPNSFSARSVVFEPPGCLPSPLPETGLVAAGLCSAETGRPSLPPPPASCHGHKTGTESCVDGTFIIRGGCLGGQLLGGIRPAPPACHKRCAPGSGSLRRRSPRASPATTGRSSHRSGLGPCQTRRTFHSDDTAVGMSLVSPRDRDWCGLGILVTYTLGPRTTGDPMVQWFAAFAIMFILSMVPASIFNKTFAQDGYPTRPVKFLIPYPGGGTNDVFARIVGDKLQAKWGQPVIIENRTGGGGNIGAAAAAQADPDGYTLLVSATPPLAPNQSLYKELSYKPEEFVPITHFGSVPNLVIVRKGLPVHSLSALIAHAKANPGKLVYGSA